MIEYKHLNDLMLCDTEKLLESMKRKKIYSAELTMWLYTYMIFACWVTLNLMYLVAPQSGQFFMSVLPTTFYEDRFYFGFFSALEICSKMYTAAMVIWSFLYMQLYQIVIVFWIQRLR